MGRTRKSREARREEILDRARELFAERGYHATTVDDIAAAVDVARGTFYLYFDDKRAVLDVLVTDFIARLAATIRSIDVDDPDTPPTDQLRANIERILQLALDERDMMKIVFHHAPGLDPDYDRELELFHTRLRALAAGSLELGQSIGLVRDGDHALLAALAIGALKQMVMETVAGNLERTAADMTHEILRFLAQGLLR